MFSNFLKNSNSKTNSKIRLTYAMGTTVGYRAMPRSGGFIFPCSRLANRELSNETTILLFLTNKNGI